MSILVSSIRSGGQSGVDRAALDVAIEMGLDYFGWCVATGTAEDLPQNGALTQRYPQLRTTPSSAAEQRTSWNVRDADATLILIDERVVSPGTEFTRLCAEVIFQRPYFVSVISAAQQTAAADWLRHQYADLGHPFQLNVAGPRESESPDIYGRARAFLTRLLSESSE